MQDGGGTKRVQMKKQHIKDRGTTIATCVLRLRFEVLRVLRFEALKALRFEVLRFWGIQDFRGWEMIGGQFATLYTGEAQRVVTTPKKLQAGNSSVSGWTAYDIDTVGPRALSSS